MIEQSINGNEGTEDSVVCLLQRQHTVGSGLRRTAALVAILLEAVAATGAEPHRPPVAEALTEMKGQVRLEAHSGFLPQAPQLRFFEDETYDRSINEELIVRLAYKALQLATRRSKAEVAFQLSDFDTIYEEDFELVLWSDVITLAPQVELQVTSVEVSWNGEHQGQAWEPLWAAVTAAPGDRQAYLQTVGTMTLAELLEYLTRTHDMNLDDVAAVTRYKVTAQFGGRTEEYRAAFFWSAASDGRVFLTVQDPVVQRVGEALVTGGLFGSRAELLEAGRSAAETSDAARPAEDD